eukprot:1057904-Prorocentrum_minimum.AAC.1
MQHMVHMGIVINDHCRPMPTAFEDFNIPEGLGGSLLGQHCVHEGDPRCACDTSVTPGQRKSPHPGVLA